MNTGQLWGEEITGFQYDDSDSIRIWFLNHAKCGFLTLGFSNQPLRFTRSNVSNLHMFSYYFKLSLLDVFRCAERVDCVVVSFINDCS